MANNDYFKRNPSPQTAGWFIDLENMGRLNLEPQYQRRSVWNLNYREFFVDSLVRNFPTQSIFLELQIDPDAPTQYNVLDGKQRLTSLLMFVRDEFVAPDSLSDLGLAGKYYSEFSRRFKTQILGYLFTVETVSDASNSDLNQAFDRLNRNVSRLNKQELRHAQYNGNFIRKMEKFAEHDFWEKIGLVTTARRRRMLDVEYVSEFYIATTDGPQDGKDYLDDVYAKFDIEIPNEEERDRRFNEATEFISRIDDARQLSVTRFSNLADFYSLWVATLEVTTAGEDIDAHMAAERLSSFESDLEDGKFQDYLLAARQGSNKQRNRELRANRLAKVLRGKQ